MGDLKGLSDHSTTLQGHDGYAESLTWLIAVFQAYESQTLTAPQAESLETPLAATREIFDNIATLLQRFAHGKSMSSVERAIQRVYQDMIATPELRALWIDIDDYIHRILLTDGLIKTTQCATEGRQLFTRIDQWLNNAVYWAHWNAVVTGLSIWLGLSNDPNESLAASFFRDDPLTLRLEKHWSSLVGSLVLDSHGHFILKHGLWMDLWRTAFPSVQGFGYLTVPRLEYVGPGVEVLIENINIALANILPTYIKVDYKSTFTCTPFQEGVSGTYSRVRVYASQIQAEVQDALFAIKIKTGIKLVDMALGKSILLVF